jgi:hypothetical protein
MSTAITEPQNEPDVQDDPIEEEEEDPSYRMSPLEAAAYNYKAKLRYYYFIPGCSSNGLLSLRLSATPSQGLCLIGARYLRMSRSM